MHVYRSIYTSVDWLYVVSLILKEPFLNRTTMTTSMNSREKKLQKEKDELEKDNAALREKVSSLKLEVKSLTDSKSR